MIPRASVLLMTGAVLLLSLPGFAQNADHSKSAASHTTKTARHRRGRRSHDPLLAYDAKDKRYYSVAWAKAHGMKDKGGDKLILIRKSRLPRDAKMSKAMHGHM